MESFFLDSTFKTPEVELDKQKNKFRISGRSLPENADEFYSTIHKWLEEYFISPNNKTTFTFSLNYYNTASSKMILEIFKILKRATEAGHNINIVWEYDKNDEEVKEEGNDFADIVGVPIEIKPNENS
ncbi:MAG: DUF1987 domain-containing protein [Chlorobi bacterium]|nr:DUF1987 domain-containing protein [Chlorobiota bacterium]